MAAELPVPGDHSFAILGLAFLYRRAWWKLRTVSEATRITFGLRDWLLAVPILLVRDASFLIGRLFGSIDTLLRPRWKRKTSAYLENGV